MPKQLEEKEAIKRIKTACSEQQMFFLGFNNEEKQYKGIKTKLILKCSNCGKILDNIQYKYFVNEKRKLHTCKRNTNTTYGLKNAETYVKNNLNIKSFELVKIEGTEYKNYQITLKCKQCERIFTYSYAQFKLLKGNIACKNCHKLLKEEDVLKKIQEKSLIMNYKFLKFNNTENKYLGYQTRLLLQCNKCLRIWNTTTYDNFIHKTLTCDGCNKVWKMEKDIELFLKEYGINFTQQQKFPWLKHKKNLSLDFYLPDYNIAIECQGKEHFQETPRFGGKESFEKIQERDKVKKMLCEENKVELLYFSNEVEETTFLNKKLIKNYQELKEILNLL